MNLLAIAQEAADRIGLARPSVIVGSLDPQIRQLLSLSSEDGRDLARRHDWQAMQLERTFTATATEVQSGAFPAGFDRVIPETFWNRTRTRRVVGPLTPQRWQAMQSGLINVLPWDAWRQRGSELLITPAPIAGDQMAFDYVTKFWCSGAGETSPTQLAWANDTDIPYVDDELMIIGLVWRFKKSRGLDYGEDFSAYETRLASLAGTDAGMAPLNMGQEGGSVLADPSSTDGSWPI